MAWGINLTKVLTLALFPRLPCSFLQELVTKTDSFANVLDSKELLSMDREVHIWTFFQKRIDGRSIYGFFSRNGLTDGPYMNSFFRNRLTDGPYMDFLPEIYGPYGPYMVLFPENVTHTVYT